MHICVGNATNFPANKFTQEHGQPIQAWSDLLGPDGVGQVRNKNVEMMSTVSHISSNYCLDLTPVSFVYNNAFS